MGMAGLLGSLVGARGGSMVGRMLFGRTGGMVGGMIGSMLGGSRGGSMMGGLGSLFGGGDDDKSPEVPDLSEGDAAILIRAMCNSAKADGRVDESEIEAILGQLGQVEGDDEAFLRAELQSPLDLEGFIREVPGHMKEQVYAVSLLSIEVDNINEEHYLTALANGLGVDPNHVNELHDEVGAPRIF